MWVAYGPFIATSLLIEMTPGPNMTHLALVAAHEGRRAGYITVAGVTVGLLIVGLLAAFGLTEIINASPSVYQMLLWAGITFLLAVVAIWFAWSTRNTT